MCSSGFLLNFDPNASPGIVMRKRTFLGFSPRVDESHALNWEK